MLQSISWQTYFTTCIFLLVIYYLVVGFIYYRQDLLSKFNNPLPFQQQIEISQVKDFEHKDYQIEVAEGTEINNGNYQPEANDFSELAESAKDELKAFTIAAAVQYNKPSLINALNKLLKRYAVLKDSPFQSSITTVIMDECVNKCSIELSAKEVAMLWND